MKWFHNMKISYKLIIGFSLVALLTAVVGVLGTNYILKTDELSTEMYEYHMASMPDLLEITKTFQLQRIVIRSVYLDVDNLEKYETQLAEYKQQILNNMDSYEKRIISDEMRQLHNETLVALNNFWDYLESDLLSKARERRMEEVYETLMGDKGWQLASEVETRLNSMLEMKKTQSQQASDESTELASRAIYTMVTVIILAVLLALGLGFYISRIISRPVVQMVEAANRFADGDLNVRLDAHYRDEIGQLTEAFQRMADNLNEVMMNIQEASEQVAAGAAQMSDSSVAVSQGATEQASSIQELTASLEEIASQTKLNAERADEANKLADHTRSNASHGNVQMQEMLRSMEDINQASNNISKIIKVIDDIAFQTNILALNAAVEAARAGQHGKGFAVVAEEVRNLAARSAAAAKETTEMISDSIHRVEEGTKIAQETAAALHEIVDNIEKVSSLINEIASASNEQAIGIEQVNQGIMEVSRVVESNSATAEESAAASEELSNQAQVLKEMVNRFKLRKLSHTPAKYDQLSPEVLKLLEEMAERKKSEDDNGNDREAKFTLSDQEFGKY